VRAVRPSRLARGLAGLLAVLAGCQGRGSDIGPKLGAKPPDPFQVQVFDDQGRPVCGATVRFGDASAVTGRAGRSESPVRPRGLTRFTIDASAASATDLDDLAGFAFTAEPIDDGRALPRAVFLPDLAPSAGLTVQAGVQPAPATLDDRATSGAILAIEAGVAVVEGGAATVTLRTASLLPRHLPAALPLPAGVAAVPARAIFVAPEDVSFAPGAVLSIPDDIGAEAAGAELTVYRLDRDLGEWVAAGTATASGGRIETAAPGIVRGGLYAIAGTTPDACTVHGRVVDRTGAAVRGALVHAGGQAAVTEPNGAFILPPIAAADLSGAARTETIEVVAGRGMLPVVARADATLAPGSLVVPDIVLDTVPTGHVRVLVVERGAILPDRRVRLGQAFGEARAEAWVDETGTATIEDVAAGFYTIAFGRPFDRFQVFRTEALFRLRPGERVLDANLFSMRTAYDERRRGNNLIVFDRDSGGAVAEAGIVLDAEPERGFAGRTLESGTLFAGVSPESEATAVADTARDGTRVLSAFTAVRTLAHRLELPVRIAARARTGAFDRHGLVAATVTGATQGGGREARATLPLAYRDWFERVMLDDDSSGGRVPLASLPGTGQVIDFRIGVPLPRGHVSVAETRVDGGRTLLAGAFVAFDQKPVEGSVLPLSGALVPADVAFTTSAVGTDPRLLGSMVADWGTEGASGTIADVARGTVDVTLEPAYEAWRLMLPALDGPFAGGRHHVCLRGVNTTGGVTVEQRQAITFTTRDTALYAPLLEVPVVASPVPDEVVDPNGFTVNFTAPAGATFLVLELASDVAGERREWAALLPASATSFRFRLLPSQVPQVLVPGRTWQLSLTAFRVARGPLLEQPEPEPYKSILANYVSIGPGDLGVDALARVAFTVHTP